MKTSIFAIASLGLLVATPAQAADPHLTPANSSKTLSGPASLGSLQCYLDLDVTTGSSSGTGAVDGTIDGGTNDPGQSDPGCAGVRVDSGTFDLDSGSYNASGGDYGLGSGTGMVNNLQISVYNPTTMTWTPCPTANLPIDVQKVDNTPSVEVLLGGTIPGCGVASAALIGGYDLVP